VARFIGFEVLRVVIHRGGINSRSRLELVNHAALPCVIAVMKPQHGVSPETDAMWSLALARGLIRAEAMRAMRNCDGYIDLLGPSASARRSSAQRAMQCPIAAALYERVWRPIMFAVMYQHGISVCAERERAATGLHLGGEQRVLDVACGPGTFTSFFASQLGGDGFVIGLHSSVPVIEHAVAENSHARAVYMRADACSLPFDDGTFDVVYCFAALHLVPQPCAVLREMVRVLSPRGRIAVMTSYGRESLLVRKGLELGAAMCGVRVFDRTTIPAFFAAAGLLDIDQQLRGISQFVVARRPEPVTELDAWRSRSAAGRIRRMASG
jgi:SAM-dependent methyltransferase